MNTKIIWGIVALAIVGLFVWGGTSSRDTQTFAGTDVPCLPNGHQSLADHIHPQLSIWVDGEPEVIPANVGISSSCMAEVHTHDSSGELHVESAYRGNIDDLRLPDFFAVWGKSIDRDGFDAEIRVGGDVVENPEEVKFRDREQIEIRYTSIEETAESATSTPDL